MSKLKRYVVYPQVEGPQRMYIPDQRWELNTVVRYAAKNLHGLRHVVPDHKNVSIIQVVSSVRGESPVVDNQYERHSGIWKEVEVKHDKV